MKLGRSPQRSAGGHGFTLVELLIGIAIVAVLLALIGPPMRELILMQRLKSMTAELVSDIQYARSEAVSRNTSLTMKFQSASNLSCYTLYFTSGLANCDCLTRAPGNVCTFGDEVRTQRVEASSGVGISGPVTLLRFDRDGLQNTSGDFVITTQRVGGGSGQLRVTVNQMGRPTVCVVSGSVAGFESC